MEKYIVWIKPYGIKFCDTIEEVLKFKGEDIEKVTHEVYIDGRRIGCWDESFSSFCEKNSK